MLVLLGAYAAPAQTAGQQEEPKREVLTHVSEMPEFPGGVDSLYKYLSLNVIYPHKAIVEGTEGRVIMKFIVSETGALENIEVFRSVSKELDEEAIRVIKAMPKWKGGRENGKPVAVVMTLPVEFEISD